MMMIVIVMSESRVQCMHETRSANPGVCKSAFFATLRNQSFYNSISIFIDLTLQTEDTALSSTLIRAGLCSCSSLYERDTHSWHIADSKKLLQTFFHSCWVVRAFLCLQLKRNCFPCLHCCCRPWIRVFPSRPVTHHRMNIIHIKSSSSSLA